MGEQHDVYTVQRQAQRTSIYATACYQRLRPMPGAVRQATCASRERLGPLPVENYYPARLLDGERGCLDDPRDGTGM